MAARFAVPRSGPSETTIDPVRSNTQDPTSIMSDSAPHTADAHADEHETHGPHVVSLGLLTVIFLALMFLTIVTVAVTTVDFGYNANLVVALVIAFIKAALVALYFMHLRWDNPFNGVVLIASLLFVTLFIGIALLDSGEYQPNIELKDRGYQGYVETLNQEP